MLFHYLAVDKAGKIIESDFEADALEQVLHFLGGRELRPISVKAIKQKSLGLERYVGLGNISVSDKVFLTKYLSLMLRVGTDLLSAINILISDFDKPAVRNFLLEVRENLGAGKPFYQAFANHPQSFSPTFVNLVKAAETSGNLQKTFEDLSQSLQKESDLRTHVRSALIYPIVLLSASFGIMLFLVTFALPKIAQVFSDSNIQPPLFSRIVFGIGLFIGGNLWIILPIFFGAIGAVIYLVQRTETGKRLFDRTVTNIPLVKGVYRELAIQRMASTMSSLMKAGLPITQTINIAADTVSLREFKYGLQRIANEGLAKGLTIGEAFKRETAFPKVVTNLIAVSEKAGHLEEVLDTLSDFYSASVDASIKTIVSLLEPVLLLTMGLIVATIALSIIVPIYQLTTKF